MKAKDGKRYEVCAGCGLTWNVSKYAPQGWYVCPHCEDKMKRRVKEHDRKKSR